MQASPFRMKVFHPWGRAMGIDADEGKDGSDASETLDTPSSFTLTSVRDRFKSAFGHSKFSDAENEFASFGSKIDGSTSLTQTHLKPVYSKC